MCRRDRALFVYGTLMPGQSRWPSLRPYAARWEEASARGTLWDTGAGFPAAVFSAHGDDIPGVRVIVHPERYDDLVGRLDAVEGEGVLYRRIEIETSKGPATSYEWIGDTSRLRPLPDGWGAKPSR